MDLEEDKTNAMAFDFISHLDSMPLPSNPSDAIPVVKTSIGGTRIIGRLCVGKFREYLLSKDFVGIYTPKLNAGARRRCSCIQSAIQWPTCRFGTYLHPKTECWRKKAVQLYSICHTMTNLPFWQNLFSYTNKWLSVVALKQPRIPASQSITIFR